jgi:hypothetical protein
MDEHWQRVFVANGEAQAQQVRAFLESAGINVTMRGEALRNTHGLTLDGLGAVEIAVADTDAAEARILLAAVDAGQFRLSDEGQDA